jgi:ubiquinone/menaquinone biosynthesis C-methylase UbiE
MTRARVKETDSGIVGELTVALYDRMQRRLRDKGWIETKEILGSGIIAGSVLEIGPGPGYVGLEWLKSTEGTTLKGLEISSDMISLARRNAKEYGLSERAEYVHSTGADMPFDNETFDAVFTNGSLHEWSDPRGTFNEIWRVLRTGGKVFISDLRRDMFFLIRWFLWINAQPKEMRPGLTSSMKAAYTPDELREMIRATDLAGCKVGASPFGLNLTGTK